MMTGLASTRPAGPVTVLSGARRADMIPPRPGTKPIGTSGDVDRGTRGWPGVG